MAVIAGPTATILNTPPLHGGAAHLRPQRLAKSAAVYVEQFSAHPLEQDEAKAYGPPDAYVDADGNLVSSDPGPGAVPVLRLELRPEDGLFLLPYRDSAAGVAGRRQTFHPDARRLYEEIDRFEHDDDGEAGVLSRLASFEFFRAGAPGGYRGSLAGEGGAEVLGEDYYPYGSSDDARAEPTTATLARITNTVQKILSSGRHSGAQWLEGSPVIEETLYWLNLTIDTTLPIVGQEAIRLHGTLGADGARNLVDGVRYIASHAWADSSGVDRIGAVLVTDELVFAAREVVKEASRPGGYRTTGVHWGVVGTVQSNRPTEVLFVPTRRHTHRSELNLSRLGRTVAGVTAGGDGIRIVPVDVRDGERGLAGSAIPSVTFVKNGRYRPYTAGDDGESRIRDQIRQNLSSHPLAGFVSEGLVPNGSTDRAIDRALRTAAYSGMPVVKCARGNPTSAVGPLPSPFIGGSNLTANKARILLMAAMLKLGALPPAADPDHPAEEEIGRTALLVADYQRVFEEH